VTEPLHRYTVLIVDDDIGFVLWVGRLLADAGCEAVPALSCQHALTRVSQLNFNVDLAIVNSGLPMVSQMLQSLGDANSQLRIVFIQNPGADLPGTIHPDAILERPHEWEAISWEEWLGKIHKLIGRTG